LQPCGDGCAWREREPGESAFTAAFGIEVNEGNQADNRSRHKGRTQESVSDAAVVLKALDGAVDGPEDVDVGRLGSEDCSESTVRSCAVEACAANACASEKMRDGLHRGIVTRAGRVGAY